MILLRCYPRVMDWVWDMTHGAIDLRFIPVYSYGFMVACGFMAAAYVLNRELRRRELLGYMPALGYKNEQPIWTSELVGDMVIICAIFGILGSNFFNFLESPESYKDFWNDPFGSIFSGLSVYGGMICAGIVLVIYSRVRKIKTAHLFDCLAHCFILAVGIGRLGCQFSGDADWGITNALPCPSLVPQWLWASTYAHNIANEGVYIAGCAEQHCMQLAQPAFPTPIYEFIECVGLFLILHALRKRFTAMPGMLFFLFAIGIGVQRYSIEQIRAISDRGLYHVFNYGFKQAELISIALVLIGTVGMVFLRTYYQRHPHTIPAVADGMGDSTAP